jgi:hypothetical protein
MSKKTSDGVTWQLKRFATITAASVFCLTSVISPVQTAENVHLLILL